MGKLEATETLIDVAFLLLVYLLPSSLLSSGDGLQTTRPCYTHKFTFSLSTSHIENSYLPMSYLVHILYYNFPTFMGIQRKSTTLIGM